MDQPKKKSSLGAWIFLSVLVIIIGICVILGISQSKPTTTTTPDNSQALSDCISKNVTPLQNLAGINPNAANASVQQADAQTALQACEAQYPTK